MRKLRKFMKKRLSKESKNKKLNKEALLRNKVAFLMSKKFTVKSNYP